MENLGEKLKSLRIDRGWTQSKMGELLSVSQDTVSLWERNKSLPDLGAVVRICSKCGVSADWLLGLEED